MSDKDVTTFDLSFDNYTVLIELSNGSGKISSDLYKSPPADNEPIESERGEYNTAIEGLESFLLALACEGVLSWNPEIREAVKRALQTAVEAIGNNLS